jgi:hypothetical protein
MIAITAVAAVPTYANALTTSPRFHSFAHRIHNSDDFMPWHTRILNSWPKSFLD